MDGLYDNFLAEIVFANIMWWICVWVLVKKGVDLRWCALKRVIMLLCSGGWEMGGGGGRVFAWNVAALSCAFISVKKIRRKYYEVDNWSICKICLSLKKSFLFIIILCCWHELQLMTLSTAREHSMIDEIFLFFFLLFLFFLLLIMLITGWLACWQLVFPTDWEPKTGMESSIQNRIAWKC